MTTKRTYSTIAGRSLDLSGLGREESDFLAAVSQRRVWPSG